ncbi:hypothetical protein [Iodobacter fluviatilis]|uniref:hypothetical protein n=1 Tax=Iodobacter fluviatilis TaxID=537 RepID=UPI00165E4DCF|nr:hypothetical protein [Iodobacter fluviatilis]
MINIKLPLKIKFIFNVFFCFAMFFSLASCQEKQPEDTSVPGGLSGLNHTKVAIIAFYVDGEWGGIFVQWAVGENRVLCFYAARVSQGRP